MVKHLHFKSWLLLCALVVGSVSGRAEEVTDVLNRDFTGVTGTSYSPWSGKKATSDAVYAGNSAGGNTSIQLRSNDNSSGVVTTASGGKVKKIIVKWNSNTLVDRTLNIYGKNSAYSSASDLYNSSKQGTLLGTIKKDKSSTTSGEITISGDYTYIAFRSASGALYLDKVQIVWTPTHTITYSATNGNIGGTDTGSNAVESGASIAEGAIVTLSATPSVGYVFSSWEVSGTGSTLSSTTTNPTTFTMGTVNATVTANFVVAGNYITVSPTTKTVTSAGGDVDFTITTDQTLDEDPTQFYSTADGDDTTSKPDWITEALYDDGTLLLTVAANTGVARTAYFKVEKGSVKSDVITINQAAITVATPAFDVAAGTYYEDQLVDIICATDGATIYYTTDGSTPAANNGTEYNGNGVTISSNTTLKAIAIKNDVSSGVASAAYTIIHPLTTMDAIFAAATAAGATETSHYVTFNNWVVSGVKNSQAFVTDGTKGFVIYKSSHGFAVGNILNGTVQASLKLYNGFAEFTTLTSSTTGLTVTSGGTVTPQVVTIDAMSGVYTGALIQLNGVTYDATNDVLVDANDNTITPYTTLYSGSYTDGTKYNIVGVYQQQSSAPHRIMPRSAADIVEVQDPTITVASSLVVPNYQVGTADPEFNTLTVNGSFLNANITLSLGESSNFEMSTDLENWTNTLTLTQSNGSVTNEEVAVRMKAGLVKNDYVGTLTLSSTGATTVTVNLSGTVTGTMYTISLDNQITGGTIEADLATAEEGTTVTLTATPDAAYTFTSWTVLDGSADEITVTNNQFTMPASNVEVSATFTAKPTFGVTCTYNDAQGLLTASPTSAYEGQTVTLSCTAETGYSLTSIVLTKTSDGSATGITPAVSGDDYTFTMPGYAVTATATFVSNVFEGSFVKITSTTALEDGAYYILYDTKAMNSTVSGGTMGATSVSITNNMITNPNKSIVWKLEKDGDNWNLFSEKEGKYCYIDGTNSTSFKMETTSSYSFTVTKYTDNDGFKFKTTHTSGRGIDFGSTDFRSYADSNSPSVYLYKYTTLTERTITFNGNGGTLNDATIYTQTVYDGVEATLESNQFTRDDYEFIRWNTQNDGNGTSYDNEDDITVTGSDLTLYAQWAPLYILTIDDNIDGGSVSVNGSVTSAIEGTTITLSSSPTSGHVFDAWNVYKAGDETTKVTVTDNQFTMPAYNVIISATFNEVQTYSLVTTVDQLVSGKHFIISSGTNGSVKAMGQQNDNNRAAVSVTAINNVIPETTGVYEFVIFGPDASGYYTIYDETENNEGYLYAQGGNSYNYLKKESTVADHGRWTITIGTDNVASIVAKVTGRNTMKYNSSSTIFSCYASGQQSIYLFVKDGEATPTESKSLNSYGFATYCSQNALDFSDFATAGYSAWQITGVSGDAITFSQIKGSVPAGTGMLLMGSGSATLKSAGGTVTNTEVAGNKLEGVTADKTITDNQYYGLSGNTFVKVNAGTVSAGKALLPASVVEGSGARLTFVFEDATDISATLNDNEQMISDGVYDLQGRRIESSMFNVQSSMLKKGLYIVNGKKMLVK